jgi:hypothetical protein
MANTKMFVHYSGTVEDFKKLSNIADYDNKIVFIKGGAEGQGAAIYTHGEYYTSAHDIEKLVGSLKAISGVMVNSDASTLKVAQTHDGVLNFCADGETVAVTMDGPGITISISEAFRNRVKAIEDSLGTPVAKENGKADGTAYERIAKLSADIDAMSGGNGSIADQINAAIEGLAVEASTGDYVASIKQVNGKIEATPGTFNFDTKGAADKALTDAKTYVDGRFTNEVTGKFDTVGSAAAVQSNLDSHVADTVAHVTADERTAWNSAKTAIDAFLKDADMTADAVDTLKELQTYMTTDGEAAAKLVGRVAALEEIDHDAYVGADATVLADAKSYANGLINNEDGTAKFEAVGVAAGLVEGLANGTVKTNTEAIAVINGNADTEGSIAKAKADAIADAAAKLKAVTDTLGTAAYEDVATLEATMDSKDATNLEAAKTYADDLFAWEEID